MSGIRDIHCFCLVSFIHIVLSGIYDTQYIFISISIHWYHVSDVMYCGYHPNKFSSNQLVKK